MLLAFAYLLCVFFCKSDWFKSVIFLSALNILPIRLFNKFTYYILHAERI